jgi:hypothetical protein
MSEFLALFLLGGPLDVTLDQEGSGSVLHVFVEVRGVFQSLDFFI